MPSSQRSAYWSLKYAQKRSKRWAKNPEPNFLSLHQLLHGKNWPPRWIFLQHFLTPSKPERMPITAAKSKAREKKESGDKIESWKAYSRKSLSCPKAISFPELCSPWPAVGKQELWEHPFQACTIATIDADCALRSETGLLCRSWLCPLLFQNGCSQSSRFPTAGEGERSSGNEIGPKPQNFDFCACLSQNVLKRDASGKNS